MASAKNSKEYGPGSFFQRPTESGRTIMRAERDTQEILKPRERFLLPQYEIFKANKNVVLRLRRRLHYLVLVQPRNCPAFSNVIRQRTFNAETHAGRRCRGR